MQNQDAEISQADSAITVTQETAKREGYVALTVQLGAGIQ